MACADCKGGMGMGVGMKKYVFIEILRSLL